MNTGLVIVITVVVLGDLLIVPLVLRMIIGAAWNPMANHYPAVEPAPDAVRKNFQSFKLGMISMGMSIHVAVDDQYLHMFPAKLLRWCGAKTISVPWNEIELVKPGKKWVRVKIGSQDVYGPAWCLGLASPADEPADK
jgi:hypothetical protein